MAKRANGHKHEMRHTVRLVAKILATGEPTIFRWESWCHYTLRGTMCLQGQSWTLADATAADIVRRALNLLNVQRPPWAWGQREYTWETSETRIGWSHCLECGARLPEGRTKFCAGSCGDRYRRAFLFEHEEFRARARERALASLKTRRDRAEPIPCEVCGASFRPANAKQRFCSRQCSGGRSVAMKMNGKKHPWVNGKPNGKTGGHAANGAGHSSPIQPQPGNGSATEYASGEITPVSSDASEPRPTPSSNANIAASGSGERGARTGNIAA
jgi:predicted nucleic acid-binding Zn ribbon protein